MLKSVEMTAEELEGEIGDGKRRRLINAAGYRSCMIFVFNNRQQPKHLCLMYRLQMHIYIFVDFEVFGVAGEGGEADVDEDMFSEDLTRW